MRTFIRMSVALIVACALPVAASAEQVAIEGNISKSQLKAACEAGGGDFTEGDVGGLNAFACNTDCQGTGNDNIDQDHCNVNCIENQTPGNCQGWNPEGPTRTKLPKSIQLKTFMAKTAVKKTN